MDGPYGPDGRAHQSSNRLVISGYPKKPFSARRPKNQKQNQYKHRDGRYRNSTVQPISVLEACMV
jgi:hypothetical protein